MDALRDARWLTRPPVRRSGNRSRRRGWQTCRTPLKRSQDRQFNNLGGHSTLVPSPCLCNRDRNVVYGFGRPCLTSTLAHTRNSRTTALRRPANASCTCARSLRLAPRGRSHTATVRPRHHYPRGGVRERSVAVLPRRRSPPDPKRWCPVEVSRPGPPR